MRLMASPTHVALFMERGRVGHSVRLAASVSDVEEPWVAVVVPRAWFASLVSVAVDVDALDRSRTSAIAVRVALALVRQGRGGPVWTVGATLAREIAEGTVYDEVPEGFCPREIPCSTPS